MANYVDTRNGKTYTDSSLENICRLGVKDDTGQTCTNQKIIKQWLKEYPEEPVTFSVVDYAGNIVYQASDLKSATFADFKNCAIYVTDKSGETRLLQKGNEMAKKEKVSEQERKRLFEKAEPNGASYFPELVNKNKKWKENEVLRLYRAITAIGKSLTNPPDSCRKDLGERQLPVISTHTVLFFWPESTGKNACIRFRSSGHHLTLANGVENAALEVAIFFAKKVLSESHPVAKGIMVASDLVSVGLAFADLVGADTGITLDIIADPIGEYAHRMNEKACNACGFITRKELEKRLAAIAPFRNAGIWDTVDKGGNFILVTVSNVESEVAAGTVITNVVSRMTPNSNVDKYGKSLGKKLCVVRAKIDDAEKNNNTMTKSGIALAVLPTILEAGRGLFSELPFVYEITEKLFGKYYASEGDNATYTKFAMFAAIVEDMVNKCILGWTLNKDRELIKVVGLDNKKEMRRYFDELGINEKEICAAIEILDCSPGARGQMPWNVGVKNENETRLSDQVRIWRNRYHKLMLTGVKNGVIMHDYTQDEDNDRYEKWAGKKGRDDGLLIMGEVQRIGNRAFEGCPKLNSITIKHGVKYIGDEAFKNCSGITSITIPASVLKIGESAFDGCYNLKYVVFCCDRVIPTLGDGAFPLEATLFVNAGIKYRLKNNKIRAIGWTNNKIEEY